MKHLIFVCRYGSETFTRYVMNSWQEMLTASTLAFSWEVVREKLWKYVYICKSYSEKVSDTFLAGILTWNCLFTLSLGGLGHIFPNDIVYRCNPEKTPHCAETRRYLSYKGENRSDGSTWACDRVNKGQDSQKSHKCVVFYQSAGCCREDNANHIPSTHIRVVSVVK